METPHNGSLLPRQNSDQTFLDLISNPFGGMFGGEAFIASLIFSLGLTLIIMILFSILRPYNTVVYAPRAKHADSKHAPPPVGKGILAWIPPLISTKEQDLVERVGLDAAVFMRFARMMRNMFIVLSAIGCGILIPVYLTQHTDYTAQSQQQSKGSSSSSSKRQATNTYVPTDAANAWLNKLSPTGMYGSNAYWALVVCAWLFDIIVCGFLWFNYRKVFTLRRQYFSSTEYQRSLHARTLLMTDIPPDHRSDEGIMNIAERVCPTQSIPRAAIARNVKELPDLLEEHEEAVTKLEKVLAKYLKHPDKLPAQRPLCNLSKKDKAYTKDQKVDAIDYWTARIKQLEIDIKEVRESIDKRNALSYGFASYESIPEAHKVAYAASKQKNAVTELRLAPKPNDLVWKNLKMDKKARNWRNIINNFWVTLLTLVWVVPNILIAVFLANLSHLGLYWPAFQGSLNASPRVWAAVQGILSPAITALFYFFLPSIFRRLATNGGDLSKTSRERHVLQKLYAFFVFNNLIVVSTFAALFGWIAYLVNSSRKVDNAWDLIVKSGGFTTIVTSLSQISPYWLSYQVQRNLGAAVDLSQIVNLAWGSLNRRFGSPTPRELIKLTAPQPFDFASYYNSLLFYATVGICYGPIQPMILPVTAFYFIIESWMKKYLTLYVYITKYESGGVFWRTLINRVLFMAGLSNLVVALVLVAFSVSSFSLNVPNIGMLCALAPLPFLLGGFKFYCVRTFDTPMHFFETGKTQPDVEHASSNEPKSRKHDRVAVRFGHPALYKPLMVPMVSSKSQHLLKQVYSGRLDAEDTRTAGGYSDVYMDHMDASRPGKTTEPAPFEIVNENEMDFEHFKNRPEFRAEGGGDGALFGRAADIVRPGTPGSLSLFSRTDSSMDEDNSRNQSRHGRNESHDSELTKVGDVGVEYPHGYHKTPNALREHSPAPSDYSTDPARNLNTIASREQLVGSAAAMGHTRVPRRPLAQQPGAYGLIRTPGSTPGEEETSYEYFRRGRNV